MLGTLEDAGGSSHADNDRFGFTDGTIDHKAHGLNAFNERIVVKRVALVDDKDFDAGKDLRPVAAVLINQLNEIRIGHGLKLKVRLRTRLASVPQIDFPLVVKREALDQSVGDLLFNDCRAARNEDCFMGFDAKLFEEQVLREIRFASTTTRDDQIKGVWFTARQVNVIRDKNGKFPPSLTRQSSP